MLDLPSVRTFRLSRGGVECDEQGLRLGGLPLLSRDGRGVWAPRDECDLDHDLSRVYGLRVDARPKMAGFGVIAKSLQDGNLVKAQVAALLLRLPDPPSRTDAALGKSAEQRLFYDLVACGLLKADADWDEKHPRTGAPPNVAWFASKPNDAPEKEPPQADAKPRQGASFDAQAVLSHRPTRLSKHDRRAGCRVVACRKTLRDSPQRSSRCWLVASPAPAGFLSARFLSRVRPATRQRGPRPGVAPNMCLLAGRMSPPTR